MRPKVTIYITSYNYSRYIKQAVESVFNQIFSDWELIIFDDGSDDNTFKIITELKEKFFDKVTIIKNKKSKGLRSCANKALEIAKGQYFMRLDADDFLDESALLVMTSFLDKNKDVVLVYSNYFYVDEDGNNLGIQYRKKLRKETHAMDIPAHGACTMVRKRILKSVGGYNTKYSSQDGHELWLNLVGKYKFSNISTPLFSYRQHEKSMSNNFEKLLKSRREIKKSLMSKREGSVNLRVVAVIPARNTFKNFKNICLLKLNDRALIDYSIESALSSHLVDKVLVTTDDKNVVKHCKKFYPDVMTKLRPMKLSDRDTTFSEIVLNALEDLEAGEDFFPDVIAMLNVHSPLRISDDIDEGINNLILYDTDSVVSVYENENVILSHAKYGLKPLKEGALEKLFPENEKLYIFNSAMNIMWRDILDTGTIYGKMIGHVLMPENRSMIIKDVKMLPTYETLLRDIRNGNKKK